MGHSLTDCLMLSPADNNKASNDPPYSIALKAESNLVGKESIKLNAFAKKTGTQASYIGTMVKEPDDNDMAAEYIVLQGEVIGGRQLANWLEGLQEQESGCNKLEIGAVNASNMEMGRSLVALKKSSWRRLIPAN
ncbi:hypothetical protein PVK06_011249 [Gossypium arboreum]|uniref:Uncharacterized protein n=1 Tax=Gossypium arboreum TaxID=29729 RepID=A0ABR0Q8F3_GOSAR|nr:hypothetical protein PVK06_011249 [Gossypium arboreum]